MPIDVWEPGADKQARVVDDALLASFLSVADTIDERVEVADLEAVGGSDAAWVMQQTEDAWRLIAPLEVSQIVSLIRFFTLVERDVSGWDAGKASPVIPMVKLLKSRREFTPELRKWIKANTDNRYLPYGSAL